MLGNGPLDFIPLWTFFIAILLLVMLSIEGGYRLGRHRRDQSEQEKEAPVSAMVAATLGLLAFMLAFTFSLAATRFDTRRQVLLEEANAIGTTYLRAAMLPERGEEIRTLLRDYVDTRLNAVQSGNVAASVKKSEQLQEQLWEQAVVLGNDNPKSIVVGLFVQSLNEVIDLHTERLTALRNRIPAPIWIGLLAIAVLSLAAMGYYTGLSRSRRSLTELAVAFTFAGVIGLIADLDRPQQGLLRVSQQAMIDLRQSMQPKQ